MDTNHITELTADIVGAYVERNSLPVADVPALITSVYKALEAVTSASAEGDGSEPSQKATPTQIRKSITPDALVSFIDGRKYRLLKRHINAHGMGPTEYCERFGLQHDYPMVASSYAAQRSEYAKSIGLGSSGRKAKTKKAK